MKYTKRGTLGVCLIVLTTFILCLLNIQQGHNWGGDFALYIHQAKSIVEGNVRELATSNKYIVENSSVHTFSPVLYPWGFPVLLSPVYYCFGLNYTAFKVLEAVFLLGALIMMFFTFRRDNGLNIIYAPLYLGIIAFNIVYIKATENVLSGIPFLCFSYIGLYLILKLLATSKRPSWKLSILTGAVLFFCFSLRTEGIGLFITLFIGQVQYILRIKNIKENLLVLTLPYFTAGTLYILGKWILPSGFTSYFSSESLVGWQTSMDNINAYSEWLNGALFGVSLIPYFIYIVLIMALVGVLSRLKDNLVLITYFAFLVCLFVVWPFRELRYLYSLYPLILYFFIQGLLFMVKLTKGSTVVKYATIFILVLCLTTNIVNTTKTTINSVRVDSSIVHGPEMPQSKEMFAYIKENTKEEDVVAFFKPRVMHLYTGRISLALFSNMEELKVNADYYVENKSMGSYFQIPIESYRTAVPHNMEKVFSNEEFNVYKILK